MFKTPFICTLFCVRILFNFICRKTSLNSSYMKIDVTLHDSRESRALDCLNQRMIIKRLNLKTTDEYRI